MHTVHDAEARVAIVRGLERLAEDVRPRWGAFSSAAMLYHLNAQMQMALGELDAEPVGNPAFWHTKGKAIALSDELWPEGAPTSKEALPARPVDFVEEREHFRKLLERLAARDVSKPWPDSPRFGPMSGRDWSRLTYTHIRHHFRQFSVWSEPRGRDRALARTREHPRRSTRARELESSGAIRIRVVLLHMRDFARPATPTLRRADSAYLVRGT